MRPGLFGDAPLSAHEASCDNAADARQQHATRHRPKQAPFRPDRDLVSAGRHKHTGPQIARLQYRHRPAVKERHKPDPGPLADREHLGPVALHFYARGNGTPPETRRPNRQTPGRPAPAPRGRTLTGHYRLLMSSDAAGRNTLEMVAAVRDRPSLAERRIWQGPPHTHKLHGSIPGKSRS